MHRQLTLPLPAPEEQRGDLLSAEYAAGLFDGEGCFSIIRSQGRYHRGARDFYYQCRAAVHMTDQDVLKALHRTFGGVFVLHRGPTDRHAASYAWRVIGVSAERVARTLLPHLRVKKAHAQALLRFREIQKIPRTNGRLTDETHAAYGAAWEEMRFLNRRGPRGVGTGTGAA